MEKRPLVSAYAELAKPRILTLVLVTTTIGYYLGAKAFSGFGLYLKALLGVALACAGSSALNHYLEREYDSKMTRTQDRPIPSGVIPPSHALTFGVLLVLSGIAVLTIQVNMLSAFLALLASFLYILVYTPMKRVSALSTTVGACPGAIPPLIGWAAARGSLDLHAGMLFLILFIWQHPHFFAIAWIFREDYQRAGFKMLPCLEPDGKKTFSFIQWFTAVLLPVSVLPALSGMSGPLYFVGALLSGVVLLSVTHIFVRSKSHADARRLLKATVMYIPVLLLFIVLDTILRWQ